MISNGIKQLVEQFINEGGKANITRQKGKEGVIFTDVDSTQDFIAFDNLGYNSEVGFFEKSRFPDWKSDYE